MKLLIVAATQGEISPALQYLEDNWVTTTPLRFTKNDTEIHICITGVGMVATTYAVTKALQQPYDFALQVGVGGSFDKSIPLGELVYITSERYGDLGAEDQDSYLDIFEMGLLQQDNFPFTEGKIMGLVTPFLGDLHTEEFQWVQGLTVNTVSGNERTIALRAQKYNCQVESMEGAAFHYVCRMENMLFAQVRSISNYVIPRDKSQWRMKEAVIALNKWLIDFLKER